MATQAELEEFRQDMLQDDYRDEQLEIELSRFLQPCMEHYSIEEVADTINRFLLKVNSHGWDITIEDIKDYL